MSRTISTVAASCVSRTAAAIVLEMSRTAHGEAAVSLADFHLAFFIFAFVVLGATLLATRLRAIEERLYTPDEARQAHEFWSIALNQIGVATDPLNLERNR